MIMCPVTNVFHCIGLHTMMCTKQLVFMTKNLCEWGAMSKMSLNCTSLFAGSWLLTMGYVCLLMNHTSNIPIHMSSVACPTPHHCNQFTFTWWESVYQKVNNLNFPHLRAELGRSVDIVSNIIPPMTDTMDVVYHISVEPICMADGEALST
jgi:hypothetical protein